MKKFLSIIVLLLSLQSIVFAACLTQDCDTGVAEPATGIQIRNWPEVTSVTISVCCGDNLTTTEVARLVFEGNPGPYGEDDDLFTEYRWDRELYDDAGVSKCRWVSSTVLTTTTHEVKSPVWSGDFDSCTSGPQTLTATFSNVDTNRTRKLTRCGKHLDPCPNNEIICLDDWEETIADDEVSTSIIVNIVVLPDGCGGSCHHEPEDCEEGQVYNAAKCKCENPPPPCLFPPCDAPCPEPPCDNPCQNPPCEGGPGNGGPGNGGPGNGGGGGGGGTPPCPRGQYFNNTTKKCESGSGGPEPCEAPNVWDSEDEKCVCGDENGNPISDKPCCEEEEKDECGNCPDEINPGRGISSDNTVTGDLDQSGCGTGNCFSQSQIHSEGISIVTDIGSGNYGKNNSSLVLNSFILEEGLVNPKNLRIANSLHTEEILYDAQVAPRQILTNNRLADIITLSPLKYEIRQYDYFDKGVKDSNGYYQPVGIPLQVVTVENMTSGSLTDYNRLRITKEESGRAPVIDEYLYVPSTGVLRLGQALDTITGKFERITFRQSSWVTYNQEWILTFTITDGDSNIVSRKKERYKIYPWGKEKVQEIIETGIPGHTGYVSTWEYYTNPAETGKYSRLKQHVNSKGYWTRYDYDSEGREIKRVEPFKDSPVTALDSQARVFETTRTTDPLTEDKIILVVEKIEGSIVGRRFTVFGDYKQTDITCLSPTAAIDDPTNLVTVTEKFSTGPLRFKAKSVLNPDGTMILTSYTLDGGNLVVTKESGAPNSGKTAIVDGDRTVTKTNPYGVVIDSQSYDILSGLQISGATVTEFDGYGRPLKQEYFDGTWEETTLGCCDNTDYHRNRDGVITTFTYDKLGRKLSETAEGITKNYTYDAAGRILSITRIGTDNSAIVQELNTYNWAGDKTSSTDGMGNSTLYFHPDNNLRVEQVIYPGGGSAILESYIDGSDKVQYGTAIYPSAIDYYVSGNTRIVKSISGGLSVLSSGATWTEIHKDMVDRVSKKVYADSSEETYHYNSLGQLFKHIDPDGITTLIEYDSRGRQTKKAIDMDRNGSIDLNGSDRVVSNEILVIKEGEVTKIRETISQWNDTGSVSPTIIGVQETGTNIPVIWKKMPATQSWLENRVTSSTVFMDNDGTRTLTTYNYDGSTKVTIYAGSKLIENKELDITGLQVKGVKYTYDAHGRKQSEIDARNGVTYFFYNNSDQVVSIVYPPASSSESAHVESYTYNNRGQVVAKELADGSKTYFDYYLTGDVKSTSGSQTYDQTFTYDTHGRHKTLITDGGKTTTWNYSDTRGWLLSKQYADGKGPAYTYTPGGKLATRTWARGVVTSYGYNNAGDLTSIDYSDSTPDVTFDYNRTGQKNYVSDAGGNYNIFYNNAGQETGVWYESETGYVSNYNNYYKYYDLNYRQTQLGYEDDGGKIRYTLGYDYDNASRIKSITFDPNSSKYHYEYEENSDLVKSISYRKNNTTEIMRSHKNYDNLNRVTSVMSQRSLDNALLSQMSYNQNRLNQREKITADDGTYWDYSYDQRGQVVSGVKKLSDGEPLKGYEFGYQFDGIGNRIETVTNGRTETYTANTLNQYTQREIASAFDVVGEADPMASVDINGPVTRQGKYFSKQVGVNNTTQSVYQPVDVSVNGNPEAQKHKFVAKDPELFAYDDDGNLTSDGRWTYTWDGENRLIGMESHSTVAAAAKSKITYAYDYMGRRIAKISQSWNTGTNSWNSAPIRAYLYDGWNLVGEIEDYVWVGKYVWGLDITGSMDGTGGVGALLEITNSLGIFNPVADGNGNIIKLVSHAYQLGDVGQYEYGPFGEAIKVTGTAAEVNPFRFSSKYQEAESGLLYYGYRYYDASSGRWISRDPIEEAGGINLYSVTNNNLNDSFDILGLSMWRVNLSAEYRFGNAKSKFNINIKGKAGLEGGEGVLSLTVDGYGRLSFMDILPPHISLPVALVLGKIQKHLKGFEFEEEIRLGARGSIQIKATCNKGDRYSKLRASKATIGFFGQARLALVIPTVRFLLSADVNINYDLISGNIEGGFSGSLRAQVKAFWGGWHGFEGAFSVSLKGYNLGLPTVNLNGEIDLESFYLGRRCKCPDDGPDINLNWP